MSIRLSLCFNAGSHQGVVKAAVVVKPQSELLLQVVTNKLRLKKKDVPSVRLFVWGSGMELPRAASLDGLLQNGDMVAVSLGEPYCGPQGKEDAQPNSVAVTTRTGAVATWDVRSPELAVVEWRDSSSMNQSLVSGLRRISTV